jgi:hypothetical protein
MSPSGKPRALMRELGQSMVPEETSPRPAMMRSAVYFPHPDGPSRLMNSPLSTVSDMPDRAIVPLEKTLETDCMETSGLLRASLLAGIWAEARGIACLFS